MTPADFAAFAEEIGRVSEIYGRRITAEVADRYFRLLADETLEEVFRALNRFVRTAQTGARFPSPKDFRALVLDTKGGRHGREDGTRGNYPPDIAARRRAVGLPVSPAEFTAHQKQTDGTGRNPDGSETEPYVTLAQVAATLRAVHPTKRLRSVYRAIAATIEAGEKVSLALAAEAGPLANAILAAQDRDRGRDAEAEAAEVAAAVGARGGVWPRVERWRTRETRANDQTVQRCPKCNSFRIIPNPTGELWHCARCGTPCDA